MNLRRHFARLQSLFGRGDPAKELDQEIQMHLDLEEEENRAQGMPPDEARHAAQRAFGNVTLVKEDSRDLWVYRPIDNFLRDLRFGLRILSKNPSFAAVAVLTLALGIGANTAIFSFADLLIRRPVALPELDRLAAVSEYITGTEEKGISPANYLDFQAESHSFETLAAYQFWSAAVTGKSEPEELGGVRVTPNFFTTLGLRPALGRTFLLDEAEQGKGRVLVISDGFWKRQFGGDSEVLGKTISLNQQSYMVIGVMPPKSTFPLGAPLFWAPLAFAAQEKSERSELALKAVGRLAPGASLEQARAEIETRWVQIGKQYPEANLGRAVRVTQLLDDIVLDYNRQFTLLLLGVVGIVLLIACANVANLQLARAASRQREIAIRASLGAGRRRILAQLVTESILLAAIGGIIGLFLALWGVHGLRATLPSEVQKFCDLSDLRVDSVSLLFTLLVTVFAGLLAGVVPAWQQTRNDLHGALKEGGGRIAGPAGHGLRRILVIGEIALALVLLICAGLMVKGFAALLNANPSLAPDSLLTFHINLPQSRYAEPYQAKAFSDQLLSRLQSLPDVESVALASGLPYSFYDDNIAIRIEGHPDPQSGQFPTVMPESVSPAYFRSLHIPLREGREFETGDTAGAAPVVVVSENLARRFWPGESSIGKKLMLGAANANGPALTVVGVVGDALHEIYDRSFRSILYQPYQQMPPRSVDFALRTKAGSRLQLVARVRSEVREVDASLPVEYLETMTQKIGNQTSGLRYVARLVAIFGAIALLLSAVGVYGVMAYSVHERRREIGIRMALGAQSRDVLTLVIRSGISLTIFGLAIGVVLALAVTRLVSDLIYGVSSWDGVAFSAVPSLLAAIALLASYIPARRATRVDPNIALRYD